MLRDAFREEPADTRVEQGGTALLKCDPPRGHPAATVSWLKDDLPLPVGDRWVTPTEEDSPTHTVAEMAINE